MKSFALRLGVLAVLALAGCGQPGQLAPKEDQKLHDIMSRGLTPPGLGKGGAGQAKAPKPATQPPPPATGN